jgi:predicted DNA-binding transcriptional regulator AlpA
VSINYWLEHVVDAYLVAVAEGRDWQSACAEAERANKGPIRVLSQADLAQKGIPYSRQHVNRRVRDGTFPPPFKLPALISEDS